MYIVQYLYIAISSNNNVDVFLLPIFSHLKFSRCSNKIYVLFISLKFDKQKKKHFPHDKFSY